MAHALGTGVESELRIALDGAFPQFPVYRALEQVSNEYPGLEIELIDSAISGANELLNDGKADIALAPFSLVGTESEELCVVNFIAVAHKDHPLCRDDRPITYDALKGHRQISVKDSASKNGVSMGWNNAENKWTVRNLRASIDLIEKGVGYGWLPTHSITDSLEQGILTTIPLKDCSFRSVNFFLNILDVRNLGVVAKSFIKCLKTEMNRRE